MLKDILFLFLILYYAIVSQKMQIILAQHLKILANPNRIE